MSDTVYLGNPNLKKANVKVEFTQENIEEFIKCKDNPVYFAKNYIKIVSLDEGLVNFNLYPFQEKLINNFHHERFNICKMPRQTGKSTTVVSYLLHYAVFNDNVNIAILANKASTARDLLGRLQLAYENLPKWMQQGVLVWNKGSLELENEYVPTEVHWSEVPGRDQYWKEQTIANTSEQQFRVEFECEFLGSVDTLISSAKLKSLVYDEPIKSHRGLDIYFEPIKNHDYVITVDVARGVGIDYSAFIITDITSFPHKVIGKYKNNEIKPMLFPSIIVDIAKAYNNAFILCEVNDIGDQVASIIQYDLEYDNLLLCSMRGRAGQIVGQGFSGKKTQLGVKMSKTVKKVGCSNLKTLIEDEKIIFNDYDIISELTTFIQKHNSFEAEEGCNDDLAMCLVIYAWLVQQEYFKELTDQDVRKRIYEDQRDQIEQDMSPFGFIVDGRDDESFVDGEGDRWYADEYGDRSYMWDYR
jgi:hypothetical protein